MSNDLIKSVGSFYFKLHLYFLGIGSRVFSLGRYCLILSWYVGSSAIGFPRNVTVWSLGLRKRKLTESKVETSLLRLLVKIGENYKQIYFSKSTIVSLCKSVRSRTFDIALQAA